MTAARRATRIVATLGPASESRERIESLVRAGIDVARLNMSHGSQPWHARLARRVRRAARAAGRPVGLMADLQGPKVRLGSFPGPVVLRRGARLVLTTDARRTDPERLVLPVDYSPLPAETEPGHEILLADGTVRVRVESIRGANVVCKVLEGRELAPRAGLALPHASPRHSALTAKDRRDMTLAVSLGVDFIALSFVRRAEDVREARRAIRRRGGDQALVAKIETSSAIEQLDEIIAECDAVMVARGDLGVELPPERVPILQKRIVRDTTAAGKPVITATQMLESMRNATRPTRAEASDVANAVIDGSWGVMLSAETAVGRYPVHAVRMMDRIALEAEELLLRQPRRRAPWNAMTVSGGLAEAGARLALEVGAR
ncbi:MAG: pyruvate kinase, partial [Acidobacteria bacterium]